MLSGSCFSFPMGSLMKARLGSIALVGMSVVFGSAWSSRADDAADAADDERLQAIKELVEQSVDWYDVLPESGAKAGLPSKIAIQWRNAERVRTGAAILAIWTDQGQPEAMATIFQNDNSICHEFVSLARSKKIVARDTTRVFWSPAKAGVEFHDVPGAPAPSDDRAGRLRQMKSLAGRFGGRLPQPQVGDGHAEVLRLLPKPLYRYELDDSKRTSALRDGAMFAFVMGTDPEAVLLLEAVEREGKLIWQYAFARATAYAVEASLGDAVVWSVPAQSGPPNPANPMFQNFRPLPAALSAR